MSGRIILLLFLTFSQTMSAQTERPFIGEWFEKRTGRHLRVVFIKEWKMVEISDWQGDYYAPKAMVDMYKARIQKNKLIMAEDRTEHRGPYAELQIAKVKLIYRWKAYQHAGGAFADSAVFVRVAGIIP